MDTKLLEALNEQITRELYAAYLYLALSAHFTAQSLDGFGHWMRLQAQEELGHAMRLVDHLLERGERVDLRAIDRPTSGFGSPVEVFQEALEHEREVTRQIHALYELAVERKDYAAKVQLEWFINEQVEEEDQASAAVEKLRMAGDNKAAVLMLDRELGARTSAE